LTAIFREATRHEQQRNGLATAADAAAKATRTGNKELVGG
jgi:hypothetical protein